MGALTELSRRYQGRVSFLLVYLREAHPSDGWQVRANRREGIEIPQPRTLTERKAVCGLLRLPFPAVLDELDDRAGQAYQAWPDRLYVIGRDGTVAYRGGPGPGGFSTAELARFLAAHPAVTSR